MKPKIIRQSLHLQGFDPDRLAEIVRGGRFEHYLLARSKCEVRHRRWVCGAFSVDTGRWSFATRAFGAFPRDRICIGYTRELTEPTWVNGFEVLTDAIQFYPPGCELNYRAGPEAEWVAIELEEALLQRAARERLGRELDLPRDGAVNFQALRSERRALDRMVQRSIRQPEASLDMINPITGAIAELLAHAQTGTLGALSRRWRNREALLCRADQFLRISAGGPFDGRALASAVGATERSLQLHFLQAYGLTPGQWARCAALHRAREQLLKNDTRRFTIEGIARECGFRHMGRFSAYYQDLFGERPSDTWTKIPIIP